MASIPRLVVRRRSRPHTPLEWAKIRPTLTHYYIDLDMTLQDAMQRIDADFGFRANEQMYKKRLKAWGLSKQIKADEKEKALARILNDTDEPVPGERVPIRHDKLIRYAKSRVKCGVLDSHHLSKVIRQAQSDKPMSRSLSLPDEFAHLDVFLRSMQALIDKERVEWRAGQQLAPDAIFCALTKGMKLWKRNSFAAARRSFSQAAKKTAEDLKEPDVSVSRITYCISSILWGSERELVFQKFTEFMANAALEVLGKECPLTIVLLHLQREQSVDIQLRIWECALDKYQITEQNVEHWWDMAQRRWRWCERSGKTDLAESYRRHALEEARNIGKLSDQMELEARHDLETIVWPDKSEGV